MELIESGKEVAEQDKEPDRTSYAVYLCDVFFELNHWRKSGGMGPSKIGFDDIENYCKWYGAVLSFWEVQMIRFIDNLFLDAYSKKPD